MRYALNLPAFGDFADVHTLAALAHEAEDAGWDGFFIWDHIQSEVGLSVADPWVALSAIALKTERIKIGAMVTPLPRRRPWKLAREITTLDHLSKGRLIVGVGIGSDRWHHEYSGFGESADDKLHAAQLDEGLDILVGLWSGKAFSYQGKHYTVDNMQFLPTPVQAPHVPIWVAGFWPNKAPLRRAARWDGYFPIGTEHMVQPEDIREMLAYMRKYRSTDESIDIVIVGHIENHTSAEAAQKLQAYADAGVTWWQEGFIGRDTVDDVRKIIHQGPPTC
ncbi:MAG TPA: LLM class flavin-dependent oxidoreductase [Dictyobacter sp.]|jgi:alkanesulfonate monooxygenase SsuD/methylene tetrahydromethanopterin reductase-like flavin-dependent oxidoreductase (luciferase family)|nr:LLM class flavin-dependent oxidoreductase [Dictyobacter sp.]